MGIRGYLADNPASADYWQIRLPQVLAAVQPDVILIELGINDTDRPGTVTTTGYAAYGQKINWLLNLLPMGVPVLWSNLPCALEPVAAVDRLCGRERGAGALPIAARAHQLVGRGEWPSLVLHPRPGASHRSGLHRVCSDGRERVGRPDVRRFDLIPGPPIGSVRFKLKPCEYGAACGCGLARICATASVRSPRSACSSGSRSDSRSRRSRAPVAPRLRSHGYESGPVPPTRFVFPGQVGVYKADWSELRRQPEIDRIARWTLTFGRAAGFEGRGNVLRPFGWCVAA